MVLFSFLAAVKIPRNSHSTKNRVEVKTKETHKPSTTKVCLAHSSLHLALCYFLIISTYFSLVYQETTNNSKKRKQQIVEVELFDSEGDLSPDTSKASRKVKK